MARVEVFARYKVCAEASDRRRQAWTHGKNAIFRMNTSSW